MVRFKTALNIHQNVENLTAIVKNAYPINFQLYLLGKRMFSIFYTRLLNVHIYVMNKIIRNFDVSINVEYHCRCGTASGYDFHDILLPWYITEGIKFLKWHFIGEEIGVGQIFVARVRYFTSSLNVTEVNFRRCIWFY